MSCKVVEERVAFPHLRRSNSAPADVDPTKEMESKKNPEEPVDVLCEKLNALALRNLRRVRIVSTKSRRRRIVSDTGPIVRYEAPSTLRKVPLTKCSGRHRRQCQESKPLVRADDKTSMPVQTFFDDGYWQEVGVAVLAGFIRRFGVLKVRQISRAFCQAIEMQSNRSILSLSRDPTHPVLQMFHRETLAHILNTTYKDATRFRQCQVVVFRLKPVFDLLDIDFNLDGLLLRDGNISTAFNLACERVTAYNTYCFELLQQKVPQVEIVSHQVNFNALRELNPFELMFTLNGLIERWSNYCNPVSNRVLDNQNFGHVPSCFFNHATRVRFAGLQTNNLMSLPNRFDQLPSLRTLDVTGNDLRSLPDTVLNHPTIKKIVITDNTNFKFAPNTTLPPNLIMLDAENIRFDCIPPAILHKIQHNPEFDFFYTVPLLTEKALCQIGLIRIIQFLEENGAFLMKYPNIAKFHRDVAPKLNDETLQDDYAPHSLCHRFYRALTYETETSFTLLTHERIVRHTFRTLEYHQNSILPNNAIALKRFLRNLSFTHHSIKAYVDFEAMGHYNREQLVEWALTLFEKHPSLKDVLGTIDVIRIEEKGAFYFPIEAALYCTSLKVVILGQQTDCRVPRWVNKRQKWSVLRQLPKTDHFLSWLVYNPAKNAYIPCLNHTNRELNEILGYKVYLTR